MSRMAAVAWGTSHHRNPAGQCLRTRRAYRALEVGGARLAIAFTLWLLLSATFIGGAHATVLHFDETRNSAGTVIPTGSPGTVESDYGDNVTGALVAVPGGFFSYGNEGEGYTPNVVADFSSRTDVRLWTLQYGDLTNVLFAQSPQLGIPAETISILFTADPGYEVQLYHFDLAGFPERDYTINGVSVSGDAGTLFTMSNVLVEGDLSGPRHTSLDFATPLTSGSLLIEIDFSNLASGVQDNIGIDNIRFGQNPPAVIPLPSAFWLFVSGLLGLGGFKKQKRRNGVGNN